MAAHPDLVAYLLRLGDSSLILGHRVSEWCGHAPELEEDMALANISLDLTGQADALLTLAGTLEGAGRTSDALAFQRDASDYCNLLLCERPNGDYAMTIMRQFLFDAWHVEVLDALRHSKNADLAGIAGKALKEAQYHLRHSGEWVVRLGDGTDESHARAQTALEALWPYTGEMFEADAGDARLADAGVVPAPASLRAAWDATIHLVLAQATLKRPVDGYMQTGSRTGRHTEELGHLLAVMQSVPRAYPGLTW